MSQRQMAKLFSFSTAKFKHTFCSPNAFWTNFTQNCCYQRGKLTFWPAQPAEWRPSPRCTSWSPSSRSQSRSSTGSVGPSCQRFSPWAFQTACPPRFGGGLPSPAAQLPGQSSQIGQKVWFWWNLPQESSDQSFGREGQWQWQAAEVHTRGSGWRGQKGQT